MLDYTLNCSTRNALQRVGISALPAAITAGTDYYELDDSGLVGIPGLPTIPLLARWFGRSGYSENSSDDVIVAPLNTGRIRPLTFWTNGTRILHQDSIAIAAIRSFDN